MRRTSLLVAVALAGCQPVAGRTLPVTANVGFALAPIDEAAPPASPVETTGGTGSAPGTATGEQPAVTPPLVLRPPSGGSGGSGGTTLPVDLTTEGQVMGLEATGERPVPGAIVSLGDGREVTTDADGRFALDGPPPSSGAYAVRHPAYLNMAVVGLTGNHHTFHLQPRELVVVPGAPPRLSTWTMAGRLAGTGTVTELQGVFQDGRGSLGRITDWAEDGSFTMTIQSVSDPLDPGSMIVRAVRDGLPVMATMSGLRLSSASPTLPPIAVQPADHTIRIVTTTPDNPGVPQATITLVGANGERLALPVLGDRLMVAALPGMRAMLDVTARDYHRGVASVLHREALALAVGRPETVVTAELLGLPTIEPFTGLSAGTPLGWAAVPGAKGYHVHLAGNAGQGLQWEAFSAGRSMVVPAVGHTAPGAYRLTVTAWDQPGLDVRSVAAVGPRTLRTLPLSNNQDYRRAASQLDHTVAPAP